MRLAVGADVVGGMGMVSRKRIAAGRLGTVGQSVGGLLIGRLFCLVGCDFILVCWVWGPQTWIR